MKSIANVRPLRPARHVVIGGFLLACAVLNSSAALPRFEKVVLSDKYYCDGINFADFNRDGTNDVVAGPYWYAGPTFTSKREIYPPREFPKPPTPTDSLFSFPHDFNGDGWMDVLVFGRVHLHQSFWYENPGDRALSPQRTQTKEKPDAHWTRHFVFDRVQGESPAFTDLDLDGRPEIVCISQKQWGMVQPDWSAPARPWTFKPIIDRSDFHHFYHGTGIGDINGDGRPDLVLAEGWWEQSASAWIAHTNSFPSHKGGAQMFAYDVDGDGDNDVITSLDAHGWGLAWFEQQRAASSSFWREHKIMGDRTEEKQFGAAFTQLHGLELADIDGDGLKDIVTGKRMWAHGPKGDIEPEADPVVYWFQLRRDAGRVRFIPHLVDRSSGVGTQLAVGDVTGDKRPDILTVSKLGTFVFVSRP